MDVSTVSFYCRVDVVRDFQLVWSINDKQIILFNTTSAVHETIRVNGTVATLLQINAQWGTSVLTTDEPDVIVKCSSLDSIQTTHHQHEVTGKEFVIGPECAISDRQKFPLTFIRCMHS